MTPPLWQKVKKVKVKLLSRVRLFATPWTVAYQAPQSMEFSRQYYWSGLPFPSAGNLLDLGIEPKSPALTGGFFTTEPPGKALSLSLSFCVHTHTHTHTHAYTHQEPLNESERGE